MNQGQVPTLMKNQAFSIKTKVKNQQQKITDLLNNNFSYEDNLTHQQNMKNLITLLEENIFGKGNLLGLKLYISHDYNIPIEINFKPLVYNQLKHLFEEWLMVTEQQSSAPIQRMYSLNFRNILLKRIFFEQKQTIDDFFSSLSRTKNPHQLKSQDIYRLVSDIFSSYYVYQYNDDSQTFFEKMNTFQTFVSIAGEFINHDRRITVYDRNSLQVPRNKEFIKRFQFEKLIQFWQQINPELTILQEPRSNKTSYQVQTTLISTQEISCQTQKSTTLNPYNLINNTIKEINQLFEIQNDPQVLESLERIYACLRRQKIVLASCLNNQGGNSKIRNHGSRSRSPILKNQTLLGRNSHYAPSHTNHSHIRNQITFGRQSLYQNSNQNEGYSNYFKHQPNYQNQNYNDIQSSQEQSVHYPSKKVHWMDSNQPTPVTPQPIRKNRINLIGDYHQKHFLNINTNHNQSIKSPYNKQKTPNKSRKQRQKERSPRISRRMASESPEKSYFHNLSQIYDHYCQQTEYLDLEQLNNFFIDIGLIEQQQNHLIFNILENNLIRNGENVTRQEFFNIIKILSKEQKRLTPIVIEKFLKRIKQQQRKYFAGSSPKNSNNVPKYKIVLTQQHKIKQKKPMQKYNLLNSSYDADPFLSTSQLASKNKLTSACLQNKTKKNQQKSSQQMTIQLPHNISTSKSSSYNRTTKNRVLIHDDQPTLLGKGRRDNKNHYREILPQQQFNYEDN